MDNSSDALRSLPSIDEVLGTKSGQSSVSAIGHKRAVMFARAAVDEIRGSVTAGNLAGGSREELLTIATNRLEELTQNELRTGIRRAINATGVILHTNLGRAPLSQNALDAITETSGYCSLEYDLASGKRGKRGVRAESLAAYLTGAEDALIVNNCASAAFLVLSAFAKGGEAIISRGELVEIGGDFRIPDVLEMSGAVLREVGTTNRTKLSDYEAACGEHTSMILRVHPSNYRIIGFTKKPKLEELAELAEKMGFPFYEDAGSGAITAIPAAGVSDEPVISESIAAGVGLVSFSGDKLLGGPQAGIIVGRRNLVEVLRSHPLYRVLRAGKLVLATLEATLCSYASEMEDLEIPVRRMILATADELAERSREFIEVCKQNSSMTFAIVRGESVIGGGSAPGVSLNGPVISVAHKSNSAVVLEKQLRSGDPAIVARIDGAQLLIDLRTVSDIEENELANALLSIK